MFNKTNKTNKEFSIEIDVHSSPRITHIVRAAGLVTGLAAVLAASSINAEAQGTKKPTKPGPGTLGTQQMKGGDGLVGTTYSFTDGNGMVINAKLTGIEYSVTRHNIASQNCIVPKAGEKLLILHWDVQNPLPTDEYLSGTCLPFSTVAADGQLRDHSEERRLANGKEPLSITLKPGQKAPAELVAVGVVPAAGGVPKLIVNYGRKGTTEMVTRYMFGKAPNIIKPLPAVDADPADSTGATAAATVPAKIGVTYPLGYLDFSISSIAFAPGPLATNSAGDGKRFLVVTFSVTNKSWGKRYVNEFASATLVTADDEKTKEFLLIKGKRDEAAEGIDMEADESATFRMAFVVPNDTTGKKLTLAETIDNMNNVSRALVFDLTGVK